MTKKEDFNISNKEYRIRQTLIIPIFKIIILEIIIIFLNFFVRFLYFSFLSEFLNSIIIFIEILAIQFLNMYFLLKIILNWASNEYILRNDEIIIKTGLVNVKEVTYEIANLQSMIIRQGFFGRIFNFGTIKLFNPVLKEEIFIEDIDNPRFYGDFIQKKNPETPFIIRPLRQSR